MKKIILTGLDGFSKHRDDVLYFDFDDDTFANFVDGDWLEISNEKLISEYTGRGGNYAEMIEDEIIPERQGFALECSNEDYRKIYYTFFLYGMMTREEYECASEAYCD